MKAPLPWHVEFNVYGGYDCMTAAYDIRAADGTLVCCIECTSHEEDNDRKAIAGAIVEAVNSWQGSSAL